MHSLYGEPRVGIATCSEARGAAVYEDIDAVRELVREALTQAGFGRQDPSRPFADIVAGGDTVLLKPNWVLHFNKSGGSMDCMVTHPTFVLAAVSEIAAAGAARVIVADAPIQSADFGALTPAGFRHEAEVAGGDAAVDIVDLRNVVAEHQGYSLSASGPLRDPSRFVLFDLEGESALDPVADPPGRFRITNYDPGHMEKVQRRGEHKYLLCKEPFEVDVVVNLPKLKAHAKAGVTAALKNLVGLNGDKSYLPHHRSGGTSMGGDCYQGRKPLKRLAEYCVDRANRRIGGNTYSTWTRLAALANRFHGGDLEGKWYGNDTTWRMVLDLNRLLLYGRVDGSISRTPLRRVYSLTDGLVAGQGNGPLSPTDMWLGAVTFSASSPHADLAHAALMHFDEQRIPLVREAFGLTTLRLTDHGPGAIEVHHRGRILSLAEVAADLGRPFRPPDGWIGQVERALAQLER